MRRRSLVLLAITYVFVVVLGAWGAQRLTAEQRDALDKRIDARSVTAAGFLEAYVTDVFRREQELALLRLVGNVDGPSFEKLVREHGYDAAVLLDGEGRLMAVSPSDPALLGTDMTARYRHLATAVAGSRDISDVVPAASDGRPVIGFAVPFAAREGRRVFSGAFLAARTPLAPYMNNISSLAGSRSYLVDSRGVVVAYGSMADALSGRSARSWPRDLKEVDPALSDTILSIPGSARVRSGPMQLAGEDTRWTSARVDGTPWRLVTTVPSTTLYAPTAGSTVTSWGAVLALALLGLVVVGLVVRDRLRGAQLQRHEHELRSVLDSISDAVVGMDSSGTVSAWNAAAETMFGWSAEEAHGQPLDTLIVPPRYREAHRRGVARALAAGAGVALDPMEVTALSRDGGEIEVELVVTGVPVQEGRPGGSYHFRAFLRDIRARRTAEHQVRMMAGLVAATGDAVVSCDMQGTVTSWNPGAERLYGFSEEEALGRPLPEVLPTPGDFESAELGGALRLVYAGRRIDSLDTTRLRKDGSPVRVSISIAPLLDADGRTIGIVSSSRDVTVAHEQARQLREAEERFRLAFDAVPTGMLLTSLDPDDPGRIIRANSAICWMLGYTEAELRERTFTDLAHPEDRDTGRALIDAFRSGEQRSLRFEKRYIRGDGQIVWAMVSAAAVQDRHGRPSYIATQVEDVTDRRQEQNRLKALALTDALTGLSNRVHFHDQLMTSLRHPGPRATTVGVIYCDLDGFKPVNDEFGHDAGDDLLRQVAHRLQAATRPNDTVARLGGDEFVVLCPDLPDQVTAERVAARVRDTIEGTYLVAAGAVSIGVSLGLATVDLRTGAAPDAEALLKQADRAMYADKRLRRSADPDEVVERYAELGREPRPRG